MHTEVLTDSVVTLKLDVQQGSRPLEGGAAALHLSRVLEDKIAATEGLQVSWVALVCMETHGIACHVRSHRLLHCCTHMQAVRSWLVRVARGWQHDSVDLGTVRGYKRIVLCQEIQDDAEALLGRTRWQEAILDMCEGRLQPTDWLNKVGYSLFAGLVCDVASPSPPCRDVLTSLSKSRQDFKEPLYLTDVPVRIEDDRTEEEKRYPELFRHKLKGLLRSSIVVVALSDGAASGTVSSKLNAWNSQSPCFPILFQRQDGVFRRASAQFLSQGTMLRRILLPIALR